jgi:hypothetical protein
MTRKLTKRNVQFLVKSLERRQAQFDKQRDEYVERKAWSQVPGYDGISVGIQYAIGQIRAELLPKRRRK